MPADLCTLKALRRENSVIDNSSYYIAQLLPGDSWSPWIFHMAKRWSSIWPENRRGDGVRELTVGSKSMWPVFINPHSQLPSLCNHHSAILG